MLISRVFKRFYKVETSHCFKCLIRLKSTESVASASSVQKIPRKYLKLSSVQKFDRPIDDVLKNLFAGTIDKKLFQYPQVLREEDIDIAISHSAEIEKFLNNNPENQLTEKTLKELRKLEVFGLSVPPKYGGAGYNKTETTFLQECMGVNPTVARFLGYNENFGCTILNKYGTEEQKKKYLPCLAEGKSFMSLAYLENGPLIDLSKFEGYAIKNEEKGQYILKAGKKWVHNADIADLFLVMLKLTTFSEELSASVRYHFFIVERNTPGVKVHKLVSKVAQENNLFEVSFEDVIVPQENLLGNIETDGFLILKSSLSLNNVTEAAFCCNLIKRMINYLLLFVEKKNLKNPTIRGHGHIYENLSTIVLYLYALESAAYLASGRYDLFENPDLFTESVLVKTFAVDTLKIATEMYTEILGRESFKSSSMLDEAIKTVQYYSVFEENIEYFKMFNASEGIIHAASKVSQKVKKIRNPYENTLEVLSWSFFGTSNTKLNANYKLEVHNSLSSAADTLERNLELFCNALEALFIEKGREALNSDHVVIKFVDMAAYMYAQIACLGRASMAVCYDFYNFENDTFLAGLFAFVADSKIKQFYSEEVKFSSIADYYLNLGNMVFKRKEYPAEHPLTRTF